jgi:hypothetical protein
MRLMTSECRAAARRNLATAITKILFNALPTSAIAFPDPATKPDGMSPDGFTTRADDFLCRE